VRRLTGAALAVAAIAACLALWGGSAAAEPSKYTPRDFKNGPTGPDLSGTAAFRDMDLGTGITECPQARLKKVFGEPPDLREKDEVEIYSDGGDDRRTNEEYSCFPQNETSIDIAPDNKHMVAGLNDYRMGFPFSGFEASNDNGQTWYSGIIPFPSAPASPGNAGVLPSGGDPAVVFDRQGVAYYAQLSGNRHNDDNGITVARSTNGGFTWSRVCVAINVGTPTDDQARCGGAGDPRQPGDGAVVYQPDNNNNADFSVTFHDKEYIAAGPRPEGVTPTCFTPETRTPIAAGQPGCPEERIGADRVYVTWTAFNNPTGAPFFIVSSTIEFSYSDDRGHSWSRPRTINGSAPFCVFAFAGANQCDDNQFSVPTVNPTNGHLWVAFENFNTPDENQILVVRSHDGGATFQGPFFVTPVFDVNMRLTAECAARGANRVHLTNSCFRVPTTLGVVADKRDGAFADDVYIAMWDNRNGTRENTNGDVFFFKSLDGGSSWIGPTRVNNDGSEPPENRDCGRPNRPPCPPIQTSGTGNDQWWPWIDVNNKGHLNVVFHDRRLDLDSEAHEWPTSRQRAGNYLVWTWGGQCTVHESDASECVSPGAEVIPQPPGPINPGTEPQPGQGPTFLGSWHNFGISDVPSNFDYCFRAGIFCGDYNNVAVTENDTKAYAHWTDARNGRSSRNQFGRNPACEQADGMMDEYSSEDADAGQKLPRKEDEMFLVTPCPAAAIDR
jgi:hypothetical protein